MPVLGRTKLTVLTIMLVCMACVVFAEETVAPATVEVSSFLGTENTDTRQEDQQRQLVRIGVLVRGGVADCVIRYKSTADYLTDKINGYRFVIVPIRFDAFSTTVVDGKVDFAICSPPLYVQLQAMGTMSAIATMQDHFNGVSISQVGGVIFCRNGRDDIKKARDIRGRSFAAVSENSFDGWIVGDQFLLSKGIDPQKDASSFAFLETHTRVVQAVTDGAYDVGTVGTGTLERMAKAGTIKMSDYRVFNASEPTSDFPFLSSTQLYPEWVFSKTHAVANSLASKVASALYEMPENSKAASRGYYAGWVVPASYWSVEECVEKLRGPYAKGNKAVLYGLFGTSGLFFVAIVLLIIAIFYLGALKKNLKATTSLVDHHIETVVMKDRYIRDLKRRIALIAGEEQEDLNIIRHDYLIEYVTPEWEAKYGPWTGQYCYKYFAERDEPCGQCGLRESLKTQEISTIQKAFSRESGRAFEVTTIPLAKGEDGIQRFGQNYDDVFAQNCKATRALVSQEREASYLLIAGAVSAMRKTSGGISESLPEIDYLMRKGESPQKVDVNKVVQEVVQLTKHLWEYIAEVSFNLTSERPIIWAVELDVRIVVANLILNAVRCLELAEFSDQHKGVITFSTRVQGESLFLMVMDNGNGKSLMIAKELSTESDPVEHDWKRFIKIGLAPAGDRVIEKWNGKFRVKRTSENRSIRTIVVPVVKTEAAFISPISNTSGIPNMHLSPRS